MFRYVSLLDSGRPRHVLTVRAASRKYIRRHYISAVINYAQMALPISWHQLCTDGATNDQHIDVTPVTDTSPPTDHKAPYRLPLRVRLGLGAGTETGGLGGER